MGRVISAPLTFCLLGLIALIIIYFMLADTTQTALWWSAWTLAAFAVGATVVLLWRRRRNRQAGRILGQALEEQVRSSKAPGDLGQLRERLLHAVRLLKTSKIGQTSGHAALYELPWYIVIGNPAAGKSSAITHSGLQFPLEDSAGAAIRGVGGTRNCDWFFTTEGILLDTAGRYSVHEEERTEWLGFLDLLKRYRSKAPINGIIVAVSISELTATGPEFAIELAKNLRQRIQELTERLEVVAPVYILFTKTDLIAGFTDFFADDSSHQRQQVWGATFPYQAQDARDAVALFDEHFDILHQGLKEISTAQIAARPKHTLPAGLLTFPLEFAAIQPALRTFLATLFEPNPYQYKPILRGFYFTSAVQEGQARSSSTPHLKASFGLRGGEDSQNAPAAAGRHGYFLKNLFSKVIFADKNLVKQHANPGRTRLRYAGFFVMVLGLGLLLGLWGWSYYANQQLVQNVRADLDSVVRLQADRTDLQSRLEAMEILQDRIEQLDRFDADRPWALRFGLYQGERLKQQLLAEYYHGLRQFMLTPVQASVEDFLSKIRLRADGPEAQATTAAASAPAETLFQDASPSNAEDVHNALKAYLMMASRQHVEPSHLADQVTRFWRGWLETNRGAMPRDQMIRSAGRMVSFYTGRPGDSVWPQIDQNLALVENTRQNLRTVMQGMPARERAYTTIKARASTRFQAMTVARIVGDADADLMTGSYAIPGTFTRQAWREYIEPAFQEASRKELQTTDWVLGVNSRDDLTLLGSPEQIFKGLSDMYKAEYAQEWQKFLRGVSIASFSTFSQAVDGMNRLGHPETSPTKKLLLEAYAQTAWDNPRLTASASDSSQQDTGWFRRVVLRQDTVDAPDPATSAQAESGPVGDQFSDIARLIADHDGQSLLGNYMGSLAGIRTRFNQIQNQGDPGPGALTLIHQTLQGKDSELSDALRLVDEQILAGLNDTQRQTLRPLLVRPLTQSFAAALPTAEAELNKTWLAQVYEPFQDKLAGKYPFNPQGAIEAGPDEIGRIFGPEGAVSHFVSDTLAPLAIRRGTILTSRTWGDLGITLQPAFTAGFARWVAPLSGGAAGSAQQVQTHFQIQPRPASGASEYTIEIDGQQLRYRNTPPQWVNFIWPNPQGAPGVRITAQTFEGRTVDIVQEPGRYGLERLLASAQRTTNADGSFNMTWNASGVTVPVLLRIISNTQASAGDDAAGQGLSGLALPRSIAGGAAPGASVPLQAGGRP